MSILDNDIDEETITAEVSGGYLIPAVLRDDKGEISFEKAIILSIILHILLFFTVLISSFVLKLLGIDFSMFKKPELRKDIEFVLVEKEAEPIDKNTKYRADINSRAGGKHDPNKRVSMPQQSAPKEPAKKPSAPQAQPQKQQPAQTVQQPKQQKPQQTVQQEVQQPVKPAPAPKPAAPKPVAPSVPKPVTNPASDFNIPVPKTSMIPNVAQPTAPVTTATGTSAGTTATQGNTGSAASPKFSPTTGSSKGTPGGGRFSDGRGNGTSNVAGNPGPGNPKGAPGIDAVKEPDFGPYMKELQRRIKMNWDPPKGDQSKRVILLFTVAKDGRLLNVSIHKSSGLPAADKAAIDAVKLTAPFRPLPPEFKDSSIDIQFTFDYNVFGVSGQN